MAAICPAKALLPTGHLLVHQDYTLFIGQSTACRLRRATEAHRGDPQAELWPRRPGKTPCRRGHGRINPALPHGPLTRTRAITGRV